MNEELKQIDVPIFEDLQRRRSLLQQVQDAFTPLGEDAPYFRAIFAGAEPPIKDKDELIEKAGGPDRLITISTPRYGEMTFALLDILDAVQDLEGYLPIDSLETFVKEVKDRREMAKAKRAIWSFPGWGRVPTKHLQRILEEAKAPPARPAPRLRPGPRAALVAPNINAELLTKLTEKLKAKAEEAKGRDGGGNNEVVIMEMVVSVVGIWTGLILETCQSDAQARLVDATNARQEAQNQAGIAQDRRNQALAASTVAAMCNFATQARTAASAANTAANNAEDAAIMARNAANLCPGNAQATNAATQAEQQDTQARAAATNADAAADQAEALCTECSSIPTATISVHVQDDDKYEDDVSGANVTVRNLSHPNCPEIIKGCVTGGNGRCSVTGPFRDSQVLVTVSYGSYNMTRQFYMATDSRSEYFQIPGLDV
jgi:hypothetical protein